VDEGKSKIGVLGIIAATVGGGFPWVAGGNGPRHANWTFCRIERRIIAGLSGSEKAILW
jgi:hypothetical protein